MAEISVQDLRGVRDRRTFLRFLHHCLDWPLDVGEDDEDFGYPLDLARDSVVEARRLEPFDGADPYLKVLVESERAIGRSDLRALLREIRGQIRAEELSGSQRLSDVLFLVAAERYGEIRFCRFLEQEGRAPKLQSFGWRKGEELETRTLRELNLPKLRMPERTASGGYDWEHCAWPEAWDVQKVQTEFFAGLKDVFDRFLDAIRLVTNGGKSECRLLDRGEEAARLLLQTVVNRLLFLAFVQKKGWLVPPGKDGGLDPSHAKEYLYALYDVAAPAPGGYEFHELMRQLFFEGLCQPDDSIRTNEWNLHRIGSVPYLHGSLFEPGRYEQTQGEYADLGWVKLPNCFYASLIGPDGLFRRFNFTVSESTPDDVEVAIDPEMLGLVFEELMTLREAQSRRKKGADPRHATGSYYTPRNIVQFMCREALKIYLEPFGERVDIEALVDRHTLSGTHIPLAQLRAAVETIKVCDPACGSGAYLVGALHELNEVLKVLDAEISKDRSEVARNDYRRKLHLLQNAIYGVDLQEFAANMARLRFWLSLAVEMVDPDPLPNLEYKIGVGDSLLAPDPLGATDLFRHAIQKPAEELGVLKARYADPFDPENTDPAKKGLLKGRIDALREEIRKQTHHDQSCPEGAFDWLVEFAEVFVPRDGRPGGFDVVLANPPYVMQEEIDDLKPDFPGGYKACLLRAFESSMTGKSDLFCAFYQRANQLLRDKGVQIMICSTGWLDSSYGDRLQEYLLQSTRVLRILESATERQFVSADINTLISVLQKEASEEARLEQEVEFVRILGEIDQGFRGSSRTICRTQKQLLAEGRLLGKQYQGGKWGGRYLRSPDVLLEVLTQAGSRLQPLRNLARVRRGLTSNANGFFYVKLERVEGGIATVVCTDGNRCQLEDTYVHPAIVRCVSITCPELRQDQADFYLVLLPKDEPLSELAERYIAWGEAKGFHNLPSLKNRKPWYSLTPPKPALLLTPMVRDRRPLIGWNVGGLYADHNFFGISATDPENLEVIGACLLSTLGYLVAEAYGRANLGGGAIKTEGVDILQFPVLDPGQVMGDTRATLLSAFRTARKSPILTIDREIEKPERKLLDEAVLTAALSDARCVPEFVGRLHAAAVETAARRHAKARGRKSVSGRRQAQS